MIRIVEGYTDGVREYRVYVNQIWIEQFPTYDEAFDYKVKYEAMLKEKASIATDEQD